MCHLAIIVMWCTTLFIGGHSHCHPRIYHYHKDTGVKDQENPIKYGEYQNREVSCFKLAKKDCAASMECLWREIDSVFPVEAASIIKFTAKIPQVMTKEQALKAVALGNKPLSEQTAQGLTKAKSLVTIGRDGVIYDMEYKSWQAFMAEKQFHLVHPDVVKQLHHAVKALLDLFVQEQKQNPSKDLVVQVAQKFEKGLKKDSKITSHELKEYQTPDYWEEYLQFVEDHKKSKLKSSQTQKNLLKGKTNVLQQSVSSPNVLTKQTRKRRLLWNDVQGNARTNDAPYSSFGLIGAFDPQNNLILAAGGTIVKYYYGYDHGRVLWVYVAAAAHDIIKYHYDENLEHAVFLVQSLDKFKFYPGFSGDDAARKNIHDFDAWELHQVFIWPAYIKSYVENQQSGNTGDDLAIFQFKVPRNSIRNFLTQRGNNQGRTVYTRPGPKAELYVENQVPANLHMTGYDIAKHEHEQQPTTYSYTMKHSAIAGVDCSKKGNTMCEYGGNTGMALKPGYCGGPIFDTNNPNRILAIQSSIGNPPQNANCDPNGGPNCAGYATRITANKKQGVDWVVGDVVAPEQMNMLKDVTGLGVYQPWVARKQYDNMFEDEEYDEYESYDEEVDADDVYQHEQNGKYYVLNGVPSDDYVGMYWVTVLCAVGFMLVCCCLVLFGCCGAGGITGYLVNYMVSFKKKEEIDVYNNIQSDV